MKKILKRMAPGLFSAVLFLDALCPSQVYAAGYSPYETVIESDMAAWSDCPDLQGDVLEGEDIDEDTPVSDSPDEDHQPSDQEVIEGEGGQPSNQDGDQDKDDSEDSGDMTDPEGGEERGGEDITEPDIADPDEEKLPEADSEEGDAIPSKISADEAEFDAVRGMEDADTDAALMAVSETDHSGACGQKASWSYDKSSHVLTISGSGAMDDYNITVGGGTVSTDAPWFKYQKDITDVKISDDITYIGKAAFAGLKTNRMEFSLPSKLSSMGTHAFYYFTFPNESRMVIPGSLVSIPDYAFFDTRGNLSEVVFNKGTVTIGNHSFDRANVHKITWSDTITTIGESAFEFLATYQDFVIPKGVKKIARNGFYHLQYISTLTFEGNLPQMEENAFGDNTVIAYYDSNNSSFSQSARNGAAEYFREVTWRPKGYKISSKAGANITWSYDSARKRLIFTGQGAMYDYSSSNLPDWYIYAGRVSGLTIDNRITRIGDYAFYNISTEALGSSSSPLALPAKLTAIGKYAFSRLAFNYVTMPDSVEIIDEGAFMYSYFMTGSVMNFPKGLKKIGDYAFRGASPRDVTIDLSKIEYIGSYGLALSGTASHYCKASFEFPDSLKYLGDYAIKDITPTGSSLKLPAGMEYIGENPFTNAGALTGELVYPASLTQVRKSLLASTGISSLVLGDKISKVDEHAFDNATSLKKITFKGDFPSLSPRTFAEIKNKLTIYYPFDKESWFKGIDSLIYDSKIVEFIPVGESATVRFIGLDGKTVVDSQKVAQGGKLMDPARSLSDGDSIGGWYFDKTIQYEGNKWNFDNPVKNGMTLYAGKTYSGHRVVFYPENGDKPVVVSVEDGEVLTEDKAPKYEVSEDYDGYRFNGWYKNKDKNGGYYDFYYPVYQDMALYARWVIYVPQVSFKDTRYDYIQDYHFRANKGDTVQSMGRSIVDFYEKEGFAKFLGWYKDAEFKSALPSAYTVTKDIIVYGKWQLTSHKVTLDKRDGSAPVVIDVPHGQHLTIPAQVRKGYTLKGWSLTPGGSLLRNDLIESVTQDQTIYASWEVNRIDIKYYLVYPDATKAYYKTYFQNADQPIQNEFKTLESLRDEYDFDGWYYDEKLTKSIKSTDRILESCNIYGKVHRRIKEGYTQNIVISGVTDAPYTGSAITMPGLTIRDNGTELVKGRDYTVKYTNNVDVSTAGTPATITISYKGIYRGKSVLHFNILQADIASLKSSGIISSSFETTYLAYNGKVQKAAPKIYMKIKGKKTALKVNKDYKLIYTAGNVNALDYDPSAFKAAGQYKIKVQGMGRFKGEFSLDEIITSDKLVSKLSVSGLKKSYSYTGAYIYPAFTVKDGSTVIGSYTVLLTGGSGSFVSDKLYFKISHNKEVGTATIVITGKDNSGYAGTKTLTFKISGTPISKASIDGFKKSYDYTGSPVRQDGVLLYKSSAYKKRHDAEGLLIEGRDYTVKYSDNITDIGKVSVTYTGMGGYTGSVTRTYSIKGKSIKKTAVSGITNRSYIKAEIRFAIGDGGLSVRDKSSGSILRGIDADAYAALGSSARRNYDYVVSYSNNINKGTAGVTIKGVNAYQGSISKKFKIDACDLNANGSISCDSEVFYAKKGAVPSKLTVDATINGKSVTLKSGSDFAVKYSANNKAGQYATVQVSGKGNYKGKLKATYLVKTQSISTGHVVHEVPAYKNKAGNFVSKVTVYDSKWTKLSSGKDYKVVYMKDDKILNPSKDKLSQTDKYKICIEGIGNFNGSTTINADLAYTVYKGGLNPPKQLSSCSFTIRDYTYTGSAIYPRKDNIVVKDKNGTILDPNEYQVVGYENNTEIGTATIILTSDGYSERYMGSYRLKFKIVPRTVSANSSQAAGK
ncbi:leucine-rich repeat protein [Butyrivibrio sp. MC2013]|uniref:leucine-rich repeat protein n=1 Tax=Butyrivibrio sp. MC2013 TaxID=1280686 RepID=UPI0004014B1B|nr:leucine-rich repeat protein [Butyrivibrio sp. MC2013]